MDLVTRRLPPEEFDAVRASPEMLTHCTGVRVGRKRVLIAAIYQHVTSEEIFVDVSDGKIRKVLAFKSRHRAFPMELRRTQLSLVDVADAFSVIRSMVRTWGGPTRAPFNE